MGFSRAPGELHKVPKVIRDMVSKSIYMLPNTKGGNFVVALNSLSPALKYTQKQLTHDLIPPIKFRVRQRSLIGVNLFYQVHSLEAGGKCIVLFV